MTLPVPVGERSCPHCETAMESVQEANGLKAEWCPRCGATWFAKGQLARVRGPFGLGRENEDVLAAHVRTRSTPLVCPTCDTETLFRSQRGERAGPDPGTPPRVHFVLRHRGLLGHREFLTEDHVGMAPGRPQTSGRDEAEAFWREGFEVAKSAFTSHAEDVTVSGDWAIDRFQFVMSIEPRDGGPKIRDEGKCVWIWRRDRDETWRLASAIWNSDLSEPALWSGG